MSDLQIVEPLRNNPMASPSDAATTRKPRLPIYLGGLPLFYGDETAPPSPLYIGEWPAFFEDAPEGEMGESNPHVLTDEILHVCLGNHFADRPQLQVFSNMNLYYQIPDAPELDPTPCVVPDTMVVEPYKPLDRSVRSYEIGKDGPAPRVTVEVLSQRSSGQRDLEGKPVVYALLGVAEFILVDVSGELLPARLLLKRLQPDGTYKDDQDRDGGVTSTLGFRLIIDSDGELRVLNADTGQRYVRPFEGEREAMARRQAEERAHQAEEKARQAEDRSRFLEVELQRLRDDIQKS